MPKYAANPEPVQAIKTLPDLIAYLRDELGWPISPDGVAEDLTFDWSADELRLAGGQAARLQGGVVRQLRPFVPGQPWGIFLVEFADTQVYRTSLRQILRGLVPGRRRDASLQSWQHENLLFICATADYERFTFAHFRGESTGRARLATFGWRRGTAYLRTLLEHNLPKLAWPQDTSAGAWLAQWAKAFDKEPLTREFFKRFESAVEALKADLEKNHKLPSAQAYSGAQLLVERLIFLYFLQKRGWLDQKRDYLLGHFAEHRAKSGEFTYYADFLERVFFTLSTPPDFKGPGSGLRLQGLPFLNGGLFDDDEFAQTHERKKDNPPLRIRNSTLAFVFDHLLEAFNFTVREDTPLNQDVAVDPEMLGKVFESIVLHAEAADPDAVAPDKRKATGSYYTPRIVVHFICRESLCQYLLPRLPQGQDWNRRLRAVMDILALDGLDADELTQIKTLLSPSEGRRLLDLIRDLKCLDPSVGSGAFPVGLLHELLNLRRICEAAALGYVDPVRKHGNQWVHDQKAQIVENCLYGVDLQQQAIEICRLRLWLSLVVDYDLGCDPLTADRAAFLEAIRGISQLPNLEMNFRRGDSLLDLVSDVPIRVGPEVVSDFREDVNKIQRLGHELHKARNARKKKSLRLDILRLRLELSHKVLQREGQLLLGNQQVGDLFADAGSDAEKRRRAEAQIKQLDEALAKLAKDRKELEKLTAAPLASDFYPRLRRLEGADFDSPFNFVWHIDFAEIFAPKPARTLAGEMGLVNEAQAQQEMLASPSILNLQPSTNRGGFDLIVGNPPFVTARNPTKRELYRERWKHVCHKNYLLVCPFFDLSFGLLRPDGQLGFIVSNAFAQRDLGQPLVEDFFPTVELQKVVDCSGLMFPGHGTPTCIVFGAQRKPDEKNPIRVAALLPGGGDLRTPPEESPLWHTLAAQHDNPGFSDARLVIADRPRKEMHKWPWNFAGRHATTPENVSSLRLEDLCAEPIGAQFITGKDEAYVLAGDCLRRLGIPAFQTRAYATGEDVRNWATSADQFILFPYDRKLAPLSEPLPAPLARHFTPFRETLENCVISGSTKKKETHLKWFEFRRLARAKFEVPLNIINPHIATHCHFLVCGHEVAFKEKALAIALRSEFGEEHLHLLVAWLNSSLMLDRLKRECFNKGAGEDEHRDRFEFAGEKLRALAIPSWLDAALRGKPDELADKLKALSRACWERGRALPALALRKLFEHAGEAYHAWNSALPGWVAPAPECALPFASTPDLRARLIAVVQHREQLRGQMVALQEEMDWLVYCAYGLLPAGDAAAGPGILTAPPTATRLAEGSEPFHLAESERPFRLWAKADGDFAKAVAFVPSNWSAACRALWEARLAAIRDNEYIRRIEAPVYKRRWDEQWKVSNSWLAGPAAYAQEMVDAFRWWLAEKGEWHLEHKARGGPLALDTWTAALWSDARVQAAWPVIADALNQVEIWKVESGGKKPSTLPQADATLAAFTRFFRETINDETVPDGIPPAVPWEQLEKKMDVPKQAKAVRGKLNVPRERFRARKDGSYLWAGNK